MDLLGTWSLWYPHDSLSRTAWPLWSYDNDSRGLAK
jgi:hypothetical protein